MYILVYVLFYISRCKNGGVGGKHLSPVTPSSAGPVYHIPTYLCQPTLIYVLYSKVPIIRPGRSSLPEFEIKYSTGYLIETFSKYPDQVG